MTSQLLRCTLLSLRQAPARGGLRKAAAQLWGGALGSRSLVSARSTASAAVADVQTEAAPSSSGQQAPGPAEAPAYRAYIDFKFVRDNVEAVAANCRARLSSADPQLVARLYEEYVKAQQDTDRLRAARNENSSAMKVGGAGLVVGLPPAARRCRLPPAGRSCRPARAPGIMPPLTLATPSSTFLSAWGRASWSRSSARL